MTNDVKILYELELSLSKSSARQRKNWVIEIIKNDIAIKDLTSLLDNDERTAQCFLWMLSDIGVQAPGKLFKELPLLLDHCMNLNDNLKTSFASFWLYTGVPVENEGIAIDLLFHWLSSPYTGVTVKSRSLMVLLTLIKKHPELANELKLHIKDLLGKFSKDFEKRANKVFIELEKIKGNSSM